MPQGKLSTACRVPFPVEILLKRFHFRADCLHFLCNVHGVIEDCPALQGNPLLRQVPQTQPLEPRELPRVGLRLTHENVKERRFTGSIGPDEPNLLAGPDMKGHVPKELSFPKEFADTLYRNHSERPPITQNQTARSLRV